MQYPEDTVPPLRFEDFDYPLPPELIAQQPAENRADSKMLVVDRETNRFNDSWFRELPNQLRPGDLLVLNNSRVIPARLFGRRAGIHALPVGKGNPKKAEHLISVIEVLLARQIDERTWEALVRPGRKIGIGEHIIFHDGSGTETDITLEAEVIERGEFGLRTLRFCDDPAINEKIEKLGHIPLPPYISRSDQQQDRERYQTVYAKRSGSVAAPTAGLHFTDKMLAELKTQGVETAEITLHVGLGTFQPIHAATIEEHKMHPETFEVSAEAADLINQAVADGRRVIAVGTTTVRTLEHLALVNHGRIEPGRGETRLFILPGFQFQVVQGMLTNFHLPGTTLLMLISALANRELILEAYNHAVEERYRFYSYGDCMLIL